MKRRLTAVAAGILALTFGASAPATADHRHDTLENHIDLPNGFQPEGIAIGRGPTAWVGSLVDGDIYEADLRTGEGEVVAEGPGTPSVGLKIDRGGRLWVAGGPVGEGRVVDPRTGTTLATYDFVDDAAPTFVNDVVLTSRAAWFTDSSRAALYRVARGHHGDLADPARVTEVPLGGDWVQVPGQFNANGIEQTPDGRALLVVNTIRGELYRVDPRTGEADRVDLGGTSVLNGDGLVLEGRTLYVVEGLDNRVAEFRLNRQGTEGRFKGYLTDDDLDFPSTAAAFRGSLYLVNARFSTTPTPDTAYWLTRLDR
ncbi:superoxide dismutase [Georgenia yuyongxinii]|uniref:Superoxide dismutase n=1 Tax=Georgenia yuyongxinii TaxID=2589797 RepID=A0A5B8C4V2_9MICO|nr:superoxide dismutase [Georgenia yuyongxinii]QDC25030.1 superoxide dismutase [Georgenia yuyongxinii]